MGLTAAYGLKDSNNSKLMNLLRTWLFIIDFDWIITYIFKFEKYKDKIKNRDTLIKINSIFNNNL